MSWGHPKTDPARLAELQSDLEATRDRAALLGAILASVDSAVVATDAAGHRIFANAAAERLLPSLQRLPQLLQWIEGVAASGEPWAGRLELPDERTLQIHITRLDRADDPTPGGCVVVARDFTATVHLETARRDFIAAISHELRTPLTSIQGYAELLQQNAKLAEETRSEYLATIAQNASRLARLARDLVTLSSIETGTHPFHFERIEAATLAAPALAVMAPLAGQLGSRLVEGPLAAGWIRADRDALHRVLLNLIENALVHAGAGVDVEVAGDAEAGSYVFRVRDNGVGISSTDRRRVFERFYRVDASHSGGAGAGLGLALAKHIVQEHGGHIELESALGQGSTFLVCLPLQAEGPQ